MIARRNLMAVAAVVDVALHARGKPVPAKSLAARHGLAPRHLEALLQELVRANILRGTRGPNGGYELARERRRISAGDVVRALDRLPSRAGPEGATPGSLFQEVVEPLATEAVAAFLTQLDTISVEELCRRAEANHGSETGVGDFHI